MRKYYVTVLFTIFTSKTIISLNIFYFTSIVHSHWGKEDFFFQIITGLHNRGESFSMNEKQINILVEWKNVN